MYKCMLCRVCACVCGTPLPGTTQPYPTHDLALTTRGTAEPNTNAKDPGDTHPEIEMVRPK